MKSFKEQMEEQAQEEDFNPEDILNAFKQLTKSPPAFANDIHPSRQSPSRQLRESKEECSMFSAVSAKSDKDSLPKKTCIIKKSLKMDPKDHQRKYLNQNSLGRLSNISKSIGLNQQSQITERMQPEDSLVRKESSSITEQELINMELQQKIKEIQDQYWTQKVQFQSQQMKQRFFLEKILKETYQKRIEYENYASFIEGVKQQMVQKQVSKESTVKFLQTEDSNLRARKTKKGNTSDDQQKLSQGLIKEKKAYVGNLLTRLSKQKERFGAIDLGQFGYRLFELSEARKLQLQRCPEMNNYYLLCLLQKSISNVEEIAAMDMLKVKQMIINCYSFNLTVPKEKRIELFSNIQDIHSQTKKLTASSSSLFFPNKSNIFVPISNILFNEDEVLIINERDEGSIQLSKFMKKMEISGGESSMWMLRVLIRACLRVVEQISQQAGKIAAVILPQNIFVNQKFQFRFKNVIFNEILNKNFRHLLSEDDFNYFPPEEKPEPSMSVLWSVGILAYTLYFGCKPFQKYQSYSWPSREYFLIVNQLQIPVKSPAAEKAKEFIFGCLSKKVTTSQLASEGFMVTPGK